MSYTIDIQNAAEFPLTDLERLRHVAAHSLQWANAPDHASLTIVFVSDEQIAEMNKSFRGQSGPTDILSFSAEPLPPGVSDDDESHYLGDIIISFPYIKRRIDTVEHSLMEELSLLVIHGALHLLGYDHDTAENQQAMWHMQNTCLAQLGISITVPDYIHE